MKLLPVRPVHFVYHHPDGHSALAGIALRLFTLLALTSGLFLIAAPTSPAHAAGLTPRIVSAPLTTNEVVVADAVVTDSQYGADPTGTNDSTAAFQSALNDVGSPSNNHGGGGVVYVPDGIYKISGTLVVPAGVTLRGDWTTPGGAAGTILEAYSGQGSSSGTPFINLYVSAAVRNLSIWYPNQGYTASTISAYPWTIENLPNGSTLSAYASVENVTLFNSYQGIFFGDGSSPSGVGTIIQSVYAACLLLCIQVDYSEDFSFFRNITIGNSVWYNAPAAVTTKPQNSTDLANLAAYTTTHLVGVAMHRADTATLYNISVANALKNVSMTPSSEGNFSGSLAKVTMPIDYQQNDVNGYQDSDLIPQAVTASYSMPPTLAPSNHSNFFNVLLSPYNADPTGTNDDTNAIQQALNDASNAHGGTVYLPAGIYEVLGSLNVPSGVELRGCYDENHAGLFTALGGTILEAYAGQGTSSPDTDTAFITMQANAGVRGVTVFYPNQPYQGPIVTYPFTFRSAGAGTWLTYDQLVNSYNQADFGTDQSNGFVVHGLWATPLNKGIVVGAGTNAGWIDETVLDVGPWWFSPWPGRTGDQSFIQNYEQTTAQTYILNDCSNLNGFGMVSLYTRVHFQIGPKGCNNSTFWFTSSDTSGADVQYQINGGSATFYDLVSNSEACGYADVSTPSNWGGSVTIYGGETWQSGCTWSTSGTNISVYGQQLFAEPPVNNLLQNGGFDSGNFNGWTEGWGGVNAQIVSGGATGGYSVEETATTGDCGTNNSQYCESVWQTVSGLTPGALYTYTGYYQSSGGQPNAGVAVQDQPGGTVLCESNLNLFATSGWTPFSCTAVVDSTGELTVTFSGIPNSGQWIQGDDFALTPGMPSQSLSNSLLNPSFQTGDFTDWVDGVPANAVIVSGGDQDGDGYSLKELPNVDVASCNNLPCDTTYQTITGLTPGARYTFTGWYQSSGGQPNAGVAVQDQPGGTQLCESNLNFFATSGWYPFSCTAVVDSTGELTVSLSTIPNSTSQWLQGDDFLLSPAAW
ncbi:MAG TPA: glycosyl hydrolase family 28-related protein [Ktedonobacterales bacterium]|nr:glycosyl hydrolase family 28-related protein [Ktedonobacterales bacterium]